jgi:prophage regulatory protein
MKLVSFTALRDRGICYSRVHLSRLVKAGHFPQPIQLGAGRIAWIADEIDAWIASRAAARPTQHAA